MHSPSASFTIAASFLSLASMAGNPKALDRRALDSVTQRT
jgi:hypothetical protein